MLHTYIYNYTLHTWLFKSSTKYQESERNREMEWNWCGNENNWISFLLSEASGDSEEVKSDVHHDHDHHHHHHDHDEVAMDEMESVLFRFNHGDVDVDDDAQSCSYDHSSYSSTRYGNSLQDQSQRLIYDDHHHDDGDIDDDGDDDDYDYDDDNKNKNLCESKMMDSSKQEWRSHKSCGDTSSNQREIDRKFWETCLAS